MCGALCAAVSGVRLEKIQDFLVWTKAETLCNTIDALMARPAFGKNCNLANQIRDANESILANMVEGFEQPTDRAFAKFLYTAKGSTAEVYIRLARAARRRCLTQEELASINRQRTEVARMLNGLIKHLMKTPNRRRGLGGNERPTNDLRLTTND